jgi:hypothetical protein
VPPTNCFPSGKLRIAVSRSYDIMASCVTVHAYSDLAPGFDLARSLIGMETVFGES